MWASGQQIRNTNFTWSSLTRGWSQTGSLLTCLFKQAKISWILVRRISHQLDFTSWIDGTLWLSVLSVCQVKGQSDCQWNKTWQTVNKMSLHCKVSEAKINHSQWNLVTLFKQEMLEVCLHLLQIFTLCSTLRDHVSYQCLTPAAASLDSVTQIVA